MMVVSDLKTFYNRSVSSKKHGDSKGQKLRGEE